MLLLMWLLSFVCSNDGLHGREEDDVTDGLLIGEDHHKPVDPKAPAGRWREAELKGADELVLERVVRRGPLGVKGAPLLRGVVELRVGVDQLHAGDEKLEPFGQVRPVPVALGQRAHAHWVVEDEGGGLKVRLHQVAEQLVVQLGHRCWYTCNNCGQKMAFMSFNDTPCLTDKGHNI